MTLSKLTLTFLIIIFSISTVFSQCADTSLIYTFEYNDHVYQLVKENKTWTAAVDCAVSLNGYLAEIGNEAEQEAIFDELIDNADITESDTENQFGTASIWLGGHDAGSEGLWIWDGDNDGVGLQFWSGGSNGSAVDDAYTNWGISPAEPDNSGGQDHLTLIIKSTAINYGLWNDLVSTNSLFYLIEYNSPLSISDLKVNTKVNIYPNPASTTITIDVQDLSIININIYNNLGQAMPIKGTATLDVSAFPNGIYIVELETEEGVSRTRVVVE